MKRRMIDKMTEEEERRFKRFKDYIRAFLYVEGDTLSDREVMGLLQKTMIEIFEMEIERGNVD